MGILPDDQVQSHILSTLLKNVAEVAEPDTMYEQDAFATLDAFLALMGCSRRWRDIIDESVAFNAILLANIDFTALEVDELTGGFEVLQ